MRVSVAMCTYNGAKFLEPQLDSILQQTRVPDELVICDDGSTDNTCALIEAFARKASFPVHLYRNETSLKVTKNFEKAMSLCQGDIIFLCDQDDVWLSEKVADVVAAFEANPKAQVVYSNAALINEKGENLGKTQWEVLRLYQPQIAQWKAGGALDLMLGGNRVTGCMVVVRRDFARRIMPFPTHIDEWIHDGWIGLVASAQGSILLLEEVLTQYRQHPYQQIGIRANQNREAVTLRQRFARPRSEKLQPIRYQYSQWESLYGALVGIPVTDSQNLEKIRRKLQFLNMRLNLAASRLKRIWPVLTFTLKGDYHRFADQESDWKGGFLTALGDLIE